MTTKFRIIIGFVILTIITIILAFISYTSSLKSNQDIQLFTRFDEADSITYTTEIELYKIAYHLDLFSLSHSTVDSDIVKKSVQNALEDNVRLYDLVSTGKSDIQKNIDNLKELASSVESYFAHATSIRNSMTNDLKRVEQELMQALSNVLNIMVDSKSYDAIAKISEAQRELVNYHGHLDSFVLSQNDTSYNSAIEAEKVIIKDVNVILDLQTAVSASGSEAVFSNLRDALAKFVNLADEINKETANLAREIDEISAIRASVGKITSEFSVQASKGAVEKLSEVSSLTNNAAQLILTISIIAVVASLVITIFIVSNLSSTLTKMANFAQDIAKGKLNSKVAIKEKGEIGLVLEGIKEISTTIDNLLAELYDAANKVASGKLNTEIDNTGREGSFATLVNNVNLLAKSYLRLIDSTSISIFTATPDNTVLYMNETGKRMIQAENVLGTNCGDHFRSPACGNEHCLGITSIKNEGRINAIAPCLPHGESVIFDVQASPLRDLEGKIVGYVEFLADITKVQEQGDAIKQMSIQATEIATRVASAVEELSSQVNSIVQGSNFQRDRIESTTTAMTEMNASVQEVANNATSTADQSNVVLEKAQEGIQTIAKMSDSMDTLTSSAHNLKSNMEKLDSLSEGIGSIINVINDIADQTNLLALNAAIEAARAGEAGRGFAVVADEVRKLAEKTMDATREVGESVRSIQVSSSSNQEEVTRVVAQISKTSEFAQQSEVSLQEIASVTGLNTDMIHQIANAAAEQTTVSEEISQSMSDINEVVNTTAEAILQASDAISELAKQAHELQETMSKV